MQYTPSLNLHKPELTDRRDIRELNANADILDDAITRLSGSTIAFSIPVSAWTRNGDTYTATVQNPTVTADSIPEITLDSTEAALAAGLLSLVQTDTAILRFWSAEKPDSVIGGSCRLVRQVSQGVTT